MHQYFSLQEVLQDRLFSNLQWHK